MFENIGKKFTQVGQEAIKKTQNLADVTALKSKISDEKKSINDLYIKIGSTYYEKYQESHGDEEMASYCADIQSALSRIEEYQDKIMQINGLKKCTNCGAEIERESAFCSGCGSKVETQSNAKSCSQCGNEVQETDLFCTSCGNKLA